MSNKPFIHCFETYGSKYVYDVNTNVIIKVDDSTYSYLQKKPSMEEMQRQPAMGKYLSKGLFSDYRPERVEHPSMDTITDLLENNLKMATLQVTQQCNLRCSYCPYSGTYDNRRHSDQEMSFDVAQRTIDFLLDHSKNTSQVHFGFYGGEPLINFPLIQEAVSYINQVAKGKTVTFGMTTNATLLTEEHVHFFKENNFSILVSLDGPEQIHDSNRTFGYSDKGTYETLIKNVEMIKGLYPDYFAKKVRFNAVVDPQCDFNCTNEFFATYDLIQESSVRMSAISQQYAQEKTRPPKEYLHNYSYEVFKMFLHKLKRMDNRYVSRLLNGHYVDLKRRFHTDRKTVFRLPPKVHHSGPCIPGAARLFVDVHGNFYPCERVSETSDVVKIGHIDQGFDLERVKEVLNIGSLTEEQCKSCWALRFCSICVAAVDDLTGLSSAKKRLRCNDVRRSVEKSFIEYSTLREFGHTFEDENEYVEVTG